MNSKGLMLGSMLEQSKIVIYLSNKNYSAVSQSCDFQLHLFVGILWRNLSPVQHEAIVLSNIFHGLGKVRFYWTNRREFFQDVKQWSHLKRKQSLWGFWQNNWNKYERKIMNERREVFKTTLNSNIFIAWRVWMGYRLIAGIPAEHLLRFTE